MRRIRKIQRALDDLLCKGLGLVNWNGDPNFFASNSALTSGTIYAVAVSYRKGQVVTNVGFTLQTAAVGTAPTGMFVGICDSTGKVVAASNNVNSDAGWKSTGMQAFALSSAYTIPADGVYYHLLLQNGSFGTTQPAVYRTNANAVRIGASGSFIYATGGTGQTSLGTVGTTTLTLSSASSPLRFSTFST